MALEINKQYLKGNQYASSANLDARIAIHKFGSGESFHAWIWNQLDITSPVSILEVGCGSGAFWKENLTKLPEGSSLVLTDFSEGMVEKIRESIKGNNIEFSVADIENLDFDDNSFDIVMAHHVIYHASNKDKALKELKRVVKNDGMVTVTTNSDSHMLNVYTIGRELDDNFPTDRIIDSFSEEIADTMLGDYFSSVNKIANDDLLKVTDLDVMINYVKSGVEPRNIKVSPDFYSRYSDIVRKDIERKGYFGIQKRSSLYICKSC